MTALDGTKTAQSTPMQLPLSIAQAALSFEQHGEVELIERAKRDRSAFAILYRRHYAMVAGYIYRRIGDSHIAEDLAADVFMAAMRHLPKYRHRGAPLKAWLYRIATNIVNRWIRRQRRRLESEAMLATTPMRAVLDSPRSGEVDAATARRALLTLPPKYQTVLSLHYLESLSIEEIAVAVGCRLGTVKSRLSRGRDALRLRLADMQKQHDTTSAAARRRFIES